MTTKPKARRFRLKLGDDTSEALRTSVAPQRSEGTASGSTADAAAPPSRQAADPQASSTSGLSDEAQPTRPARPATGTDTRPPRGGTSADEGTAARTNAQQTGSTDRAKGDTASTETGSSADQPQSETELTGRQLRMAMRVAQRNGIKASSGLEAVRLLRQQGIDPFERSTLLDIVKEEGSKSRALTTTEQPQLPKAYRQPGTPALADPVPPHDQRKAEISRIQRDIRKRRRRRMLLLAARLGIFVTLPTLIAAWYFFVVATPLYATNSEFVIQQADSNAGGGAAGALSGMFGGAAMGSNQDSITVQSYLQSRDAMRRLDTEEGFKSYFQNEDIDPLRRLPPDATDEAAYRLYQDMVQVSFDPTEGIIRMEVIAADPETSERFARALVSYAEEQVDQLTQRLRENQMADAEESVAQAEARMNEAQLRVLETQERFQMLSSEVEVTLLTQQISNLETQLNLERLSLSDLRANPRPNPARLEQAERRVATLESQIAGLRGSLTQGGENSPSVARLQREQVMAESDVATRQMLLAQAMQQLEAARIEANRQVRYLSLGVSPVAPDEPTYPRAFENTALAFLIFAGIYLLISMTAAILREQITG
ncbi:capsule biosynthesis protein [Rhodobacter sp. NTK016B]|uniref:capsule biosynthesis protein n=1 Tax=Rhodobacter sp. NTK016B TaxID=2759676 RepID=UPI001A8E3F31|nr:capsule biosynthesis protein [Rhodobacter sp. NTK016B]MBN8291546.1 capsule biosynthesis protein [Rhodobacter sp. NTK016B]